LSVFISLSLITDIVFKVCDSYFEVKSIMFYNYAICLQQFHILSSNTLLQLFIVVKNVETRLAHKYQP